ncbi:hypothetical protein BKA62DRAFT_626848 [Auriculariales sp. MPI-PUGE-AT-0066]|nr:hypothetical protein BKA62DRAFT_626848 [Auriculariales sp. MPI-PUGE-AT-0066]
MLISTALATTVNVNVGVDGTGKQAFTFDPASVVAQNGDDVVFSFKLPDSVTNPSAIPHTVTQSSFDKPCSQLAGGFDTGLSPVATDGKTFTLHINDTKPAWYFCAVHCQAGMVFAVNAPETGNTFANFQTAARNAASIDYTPSAAPSNSQSPAPSDGGSQPSTPSPTATKDQTGGGGYGGGYGGGPGGAASVVGTGAGVVAAAAAIVFWAL